METAATLHRNLAADQLNQVCHEAAIAQDRRFAVQKSRTCPKEKVQEIEDVLTNLDYFNLFFPLQAPFFFIIFIFPPPIPQAMHDPWVVPWHPRR